EIGVQDKGVYLVEAVKGELRAYTILIVSDAVMLTKTAKGRIVNLVMDRNTGEPIAGAKIWMLTRQGRQGEAETDAGGIAEIKVAAERPDDVRVVGKIGGDFLVNMLGQWAFGPNHDDLRGYIYTDRPVYRPGHTVHFKGILRARSAAGYNVPAG